MRSSHLTALSISVIAVILCLCIAQSAFAGSIVGWGDNQEGQATPPEGNDFVAIAAGALSSLALKSDGSIVSWGSDLSTKPPDSNDFVAIAAGGPLGPPMKWVGYGLALKSDGSIVCWDHGPVTPPDGNDFVAIAGGYGHSLALKSDGSIVGWGPDAYGETTPPDGNDFVAIAAGFGYSLALKSDGSITGWGDNRYGQATPPDGNDFVAIAGGQFHSLALKSDGSIVSWPAQSLHAPPPGNDFVAISAGYNHSLALKKDCQYVLKGDLNNDCKVDFSDFAIMAANWLIDCDLNPSDPACVPKNRVIEVSFPAAFNHSTDTYQWQ